MAFYKYLYINEEALPLADDLDIDVSDVTADSSGETEAGTQHRDVIRRGVVSISAKYTATYRYVKKFAKWRKEDEIQVTFIDPETFTRRTEKMFIDKYKQKLVRDTKYGGIWTVELQFEMY